jgi:DNA polymerase
MTELNQEFLDIVTQIRTHLEYQKALGVRHIETASVRAVASGAAPAPAAGFPVVHEEARVHSRAALSKGGMQAIFGEGNPGAAIFFIVASTGREEGQAGKLFTDPADKLLTDIIVKGMKLRRENVYICGIVPDRSPDERGSWEPFLKIRLEAMNPRVIVAMGDAASRALLKTTEDIAVLRGKWHSYEGIPLMPTLHPADLLDHPEDKKPVWEDIQKVMEKLKTGARSQKPGVRRQHE